MSGTVQFKNYIGGKWRESTSGATTQRHNPATGALIGTYTKSTPQDVDAAVAAAKTGVPKLAPLPRPQARRTPLQGRPRPRGPQGATRPRDDRGDGQGHRRGPWRCPGGHRHDLLHGGRRSPPLRPDHPLGDAQQVPDVDPQAARRLRHDHPLELPDGDPHLEDDARPHRRQHRSSSSPPPSPPAPPSASSKSSKRPGCPPASSISSSAAARRSATPSSPTPMSPSSPSPAPTPPASMSPSRRPPQQARLP